MKNYKFNRHGFSVIKKAVSKDLATFCYNYLLMKENALHFLLRDQYVSPEEDIHGLFGDPQIGNDVFNIYGDPAMDTLMLKCQTVMEKETGIPLIPTYTYARNYLNGSELKRHKDRPSCEISCTMNLGGDKWPIFIEPNKNKGRMTDNGYVSDFTKGVKVDLSPGDILIYKGCDLEHWREEFKGEKCVQVFLHYNKAKSQENLYDKRPTLGLPSWYSKNEQK